MFIIEFRLRTYNNNILYRKFEISLENLLFIMRILEKNNNYYYIPPDDIVEKCVYWIKKSNKAVFFRFPNLEEGS